MLAGIGMAARYGLQDIRWQGRGNFMKTLTVLLAIVISVCAITAAAAGGYHLLQKVSVPGDEGWDYCIVDAAGRRVYISHSSHVMVLNADTGEVAGTIEKTDGVHGIAIAADLGRGF